MSRRSTPERLDEDRRIATRNSLIGEGVPEDQAAAWLAGSGDKTDQPSNGE